MSISISVSVSMSISISISVPVSVSVSMSISMFYMCMYHIFTVALFPEGPQGPVGPTGEQGRRIVWNPSDPRKSDKCHRNDRAYAKMMAAN